MSARTWAGPLGRCRRAAAVLAAATVLAVGAAGCSDDGDDKGNAAGNTPAQASSETTQKAGQPAAEGGADDLQSAYRKVVTDVLSSVVQITTPDGLGSGIVYDDKGNIVTNAHVVGNATAFQVTLATGAQPLTAKLVASYPPNDVAVIRLDNPPGDLKPAQWGDSSRIDVGTIVLAMGNPLGLSGSVSQGIVSALNRTQSEAADSGSPGATIPNLIQTTAAINPGNSGGALVDLEGKVVGIPTLAAATGAGNSLAPGIGFAIPSNTAKNLADQMIKDGKVTDSDRAALGITATTVVGRGGDAAGVGVVTVDPNGAAGRAGIQAGDVITAVNGTDTANQAALAEVLAGLKPGDTAKVSLVRAGGGDATVDVTLGELS
ncbi:S1C family serine protease [Streptodolium elevatio]|uniref:Trypsin-like peptidase domain-containing protein n=1 Tax=Streptodolium elevatio TaxID=3157996 RepID=A0ABV3DLU0_9ACTN